MPEDSRDDPPERPDPALPTAPGAPSAPGAIDLPATFGKYFLTEKLATGGMAEIYLAKIVGPGGFEKSLVIKQIHPRLSGQRHFVDLFVAEAKTLVTLAHGNIVPVYELGVIDDTYFIAMEYIDGPTLYRLTETLRRRDARMAPPIAAWIAARILEGLDYAHRKGDGVIHRDLSPRNVMLSRDGEVKLVDFGIAVTLGAAGEDDASQSAPTGSFPYMSPEQVRREPLTPQTDLFTVGVLLWEMLVGHRLFARPDPDATLRAVVDGDIARPSAENPEVPGRLDDVVMRALERDTAARWASAADMLAALQRYLYSLDDTPGPRDVAALVARYCPPETRRLPTHHDEIAEPEAGDAPSDASADTPATRPTWAARAAAPGTSEPRPGPATAVIPRAGAARGKRGPRARTETFATHVELEQMLERSAPAAEPAAAAAPDGKPRRIDDASGDVRATRPDRGDATPARPRAARTSDGEPVPGPASAERSAEPVDPDAPIPRPERPPLELPGRAAPSSSLLTMAAIGALVLGGAAIFMFFQGRAGALRPDAQLPREAAALAPDAALAPLAAAPDAAPPAPPVDAEPAPLPDAATAPLPASPRDARTAAPRHDAAPHPAHDAGSSADLGRVDAGARPTGTATLTIGAIPWGNVLVDGAPIGRTPIEHRVVPAGHHVITVTFAGEDPPRTLSYTVDLAPGQAKDVFADFNHP